MIGLFYGRRAKYTYKPHAAAGTPKRSRNSPIMDFSLPMPDIRRIKWVKYVTANTR